MGEAPGDAVSDDAVLAMPFLAMRRSEEAASCGWARTACHTRMRVSLRARTRRAPLANRTLYTTLCKRCVVRAGVVEHNICFLIHYIHARTRTRRRTPRDRLAIRWTVHHRHRVMVISSNLNYGIKGSTLVAVTCQLSVPHRDTPHVTRTGLRHPRRLATQHTRGVTSRHEAHPLFCTLFARAVISSVQTVAWSLLAFFAKDALQGAPVPSYAVPAVSVSHAARLRLAAACGTCAPGGPAENVAVTR